MRLDTVAQLLEAVASLPAPRRAQARARVAAAIARPAPEARAALGLLALDLAPELAAQGGSEDVLVLPEAGTEPGTAARPDLVHASA